jgi:hypothetical protein
MIWTPLMLAVTSAGKPGIWEHISGITQLLERDAHVITLLRVFFPNLSIQKCLYNS